MSIFDRGVVLDVYPEVETTDRFGNVLRVPGDEAIEVRGVMQAAGHENITGRSEDALFGQEVESQVRFLCRSFPAGPWGRVVYDGREWDVVGESRFYIQTAATKHLTVRLQARKPPALPDPL